MNTIIFDVDDTLYDQAASFHRTVRRLFDHPFTDEEIDRLFRSSRKHSEILFDKSEAGLISTYEWQTGRIIAACQEFNIPINAEKAATFNEVYVEEQKEIMLYTEVEELLDLLIKEGKQLAVLTNGEVNHQAMKIEKLGLDRWIRADHTFISGAIGHAKPKREPFLFIEEKLGLDRSQTVYIGDSFEKDIIGAKQVGWKAIWMNHRKRHVPDGAIFQPDNEVHSAIELLNLFKAPQSPKTF
ncbi:HAD family hydrolase [Bacillus suaedae]|uniref:HAD family hydrolase n=1 Tax=Halalkalibacter suaedae TaxID=2822140 RepID=A0A941ANC9_9BACI|nr:HAD family hydrolase [Bacillus suaedae]MBP3950187.1 HAD family hydrolase [Bacillus suaedae]